MPGGGLQQKLHRVFLVSAVNDLGDLKTMAHLLVFDSVLGRLPVSVHADSETIVVGKRGMRALSIPDPADLPWRELGVDLVLRFTPQRQSTCKGLSTLRRQRYRPAPRIGPIADSNQTPIGQQVYVAYQDLSQT